MISMDSDANDGYYSPDEIPPDDDELSEDLQDIDEKE
jgi:hypothetical protein